MKRDKRGGNKNKYIKRQFCASEEKDGVEG